MNLSQDLDQGVQILEWMILPGLPRQLSWRLDGILSTAGCSVVMSSAHFCLSYLPVIFFEYLLFNEVSILCGITGALTLSRLTLSSSPMRSMNLISLFYRCRLTGIAYRNPFPLIYCSLIWTDQGFLDHLISECTSSLAFGGR